MTDQFRFYPAKFVMRSQDMSTLRITDIWKFRSTKSNKTYIIEMEHFDHNLIGVKFFYKGNRWSENRYSLMTNDNEPRTIVYSCLELMRQYYLKDNTVSFGFIAAEEIDPSKKSESRNRRYRFYKTLVVDYFGEKTFLHIDDPNERLYLLLNISQIKQGKLSSQAVNKTINNLFIYDFNGSWD